MKGQNNRKSPRLSRRKARTPEERDNQMIALTIDKVEERMLNGTASSQEYVHYLRLGANREKMLLEKEKLELELELVKARTEAINATQKDGELYAKAIAALGTYRGTDDEDSDLYGDE